MADIINRDDYISVAQAIGNAVSPLSTVADYYLEAATVILDADEFDVELDLLRPFHNAYLSASTIYTSTPNSAIEAVRSLQEHVARRNTSGTGGAALTVVGWLKAQTPPVTVTDLTGDFCTVSAAAGYPLRYDEVSAADQAAGNYIAES